MLDARLYLLQRMSAMLMAPMVFIHLGTIIYAIQGGITASEILARTQGSLFWGSFYALFVIAVAIHAAIGVRVILFEWCRLSGRLLDHTTWAIGLALCLTGLRAVYGVVLA